MKLHPGLLGIVACLGLSASAFAADGKAIWNEHCSKCHGKDGRGQTKEGKKLNIPDFSTKKVQSLFTDDQAFKIIKEGLRDDTDKVSMKAVEGLSDDDIRAVIKYLRTLKK